MAAGRFAFCNSPIISALRTVADHDAINKLRSKLIGRLVLPGGLEYGAARRVIEMPSANNKHPAVVAWCPEWKAVKL